MSHQACVSVSAAFFDLEKKYHSVIPSTQRLKCQRKPATPHESHTRVLYVRVSSNKK